MPTLVYTPAAKKDLASIHTWSVRQFGTSQADLYVRAIDSALYRAAQIPGILRDASEVRSGLSRLHTGSHISFVRIADGELRVIRILHARMDPDRWV